MAIDESDQYPAGARILFIASLCTRSSNSPAGDHHAVSTTDCVQVFLRIRTALLYTLSLSLQPHPKYSFPPPPAHDRSTWITRPSSRPGRESPPPRRSFSPPSCSSPGSHNTSRASCGSSMGTACCRYTIRRTSAEMAAWMVLLMMLMWVSAVVSACGAGFRLRVWRLVPRPEKTPRSNRQSREPSASSSSACPQTHWIPRHDPLRHPALVRN
ncbi:uncharacterized protein B0H18DRAFT_105231 [Fomitopsis serialis]|uniref:uncharacterized protein n=1 Tax=Fomitopsis serialis TaxID=139415 RepID=UPI002007B9BC|nr:uncharacterized protein B0H18DRAFT_105231 [Neoantrodia serialis]KAH9931358.1 hypothetical protein B0H18DRAFT_105231 [Neoantrodia serialis]